MAKITTREIAKQCVEKHNGDKEKAANEFSKEIMKYPDLQAKLWRKACWDAVCEYIREQNEDFSHVISISIPVPGQVPPKLTTLDILDKLRNIVAYYSTVRQVGNTTMMVEGVNKHLLGFKCDKPVVMIGNGQQGRLFRELCPGADQVSWSGNLEGLRGRRQPLAWDNCAILMMADEAAQEIEKLQEEVDQLNDRIRKVRSVL